MPGMMRTHRPVSAKGRTGHMGSSPGGGPKMGMSPAMPQAFGTRKLPGPVRTANAARPRTMKTDVASLLRKLM